mmetsp:Transcript_24434/g.50771  ORF Transcript_24434/g.50771 Transcript_24434/m.50771 type:complete len:217 (+) Transcript_24434:932-1582(+)
MVHVHALIVIARSNNIVMRNGHMRRIHNIFNKKISSIRKLTIIPWPIPNAIRIRFLDFLQTAVRLRGGQGGFQSSVRATFWPHPNDTVNNLHREAIALTFRVFLNRFQLGSFGLQLRSIHQRTLFSLKPPPMITAEQGAIVFDTTFAEGHFTMGTFIQKSSPFTFFSFILFGSLLFAGKGSSWNLSVIPNHQIHTKQGKFMRNFGIQHFHRDEGIP